MGEVSAFQNLWVVGIGGLGFAVEEGGLEEAESGIYLLDSLLG